MPRFFSFFRKWPNAVPQAFGSFVFALLFLFLFPRPLLADRIALKSGRVMVGTIIKETPEEVWVEISGGTTKIPRSWVVWTLQGSEEAINRSARTGYLFKQGERSIKEGRFIEASQFFEQAVELTEDSFHIWNSLGVAYAKNRQWGKAVSAFQRAHQLAPSQHDVTDNLANATMEVGDFKNAQRLYHGLLNSNLNPAILYAKLSVAFYKDKHYAQASKLYKVASKRGLLQRLHTS